MRIVAASDLHLDLRHADALIAAASEADLVIVAGDFAQRREGLEDYMQAFEPISENAIFVAGNNETIDELRAATSVPCLHGEVMDRSGLRIAGIGGAVPPLPPLDWPSWDHSEAAAGALLDEIEGCDILISHSPPKAVCDRHAEMGSIGSTAVYAAAERMHPKLLLCGHVHDDWGACGRIGETRVLNLGPEPVFLEIEP